MTDETLADRWIRRLKNQRIFAALVVFGVVMAAIESFTGTISTLIEAISGEDLLSTEDVLLHASWQSVVFKNSATISSGEVLRGRLDPSTQLKLALRNQGSISASNIVVGIEGNGGTIAQASEYFQGQEEEEESERPWLLTTFWKSKPGVALSGLPRGAESKELALQMTTLNLGRFSWDRDVDEGIYQLRIVVTADEMSKPAEFGVSFEPLLRDRGANAN